LCSWFFSQVEREEQPLFISQPAHGIDGTIKTLSKKTGRLPTLEELPGRRVMNENGISLSHKTRIADLGPRRADEQAGRSVICFLLYFKELSVFVGTIEGQFVYRRPPSIDTWRRPCAPRSIPETYVSPPPTTIPPRIISK